MAQTRLDIQLLEQRQNANLWPNGPICISTVSRYKWELSKLFSMKHQTKSRFSIETLSVVEDRKEAPQLSVLRARELGKLFSTSPIH